MTGEAGAAAGQATHALGARLLTRLMNRDSGEPDAELDTASRDVADNPGDEDFEAALRAKLKKALREADPGLLAELAAATGGSGQHAVAHGTRSVAGTVSGTVITGDRNKFRRHGR
ncbi:hypothetical protein [Amycolatopsis albispora]|uniref:hypothetical protein n=1 Tax=Amycolatopsis albispora TaxID=1804986 RepID=UPI0013B3A641|nr:hypothetical protein [Amycolatopsis albispora]